jgi:hypothetical protein
LHIRSRVRTKTFSETSITFWPGEREVHYVGEERGTDRIEYLEVDRAIDNLVKSGKMFGAPGGRGKSDTASACYSEAAGLCLWERIADLNYSHGRQPET